MTAPTYRSSPVRRLAKARDAEAMKDLPRWGVEQILEIAAVALLSEPGVEASCACRVCDRLRQLKRRHDLARGVIEAAVDGHDDRAEALLQEWKDSASG